MNTSDLRDTLASHATFEDDGLTARVVGVRERVRVVRRRRRAAVGGTVAAVLAIGAAGVAIPKLTNDAAPASRELAGHTAPATLESLGYTYEFERGVEGDGEVVLELPKSDEPSLVTWATEGRDNRVTVRSDGSDPYHSSLDDFTDFTLAGPSNSSMRYTLKGSGPVAVAVYRLTDLAPAGVTKGGFTYRDRVGGGKMLAAKIGNTGENELELSFRMPTEGLSIRPLCQTSRSGTLSISFNGNAGPATECQADEAWDVGGGSKVSFDEVTDKNGRTIRPGAQVRIRVSLTDPQSGRELIEDDGVRLGIGVYSVPQMMHALDGVPVDKFVEFDGHLWLLTDSLAVPDIDQLSLSVAGRHPKLVGFAGKNLGPGTMRMTRLDRNGRPLESGGGSWQSGSPSAMTTGGYDLVTEDATVGLQFEGGVVGPTTRFALLGYTRVD